MVFVLLKTIASFALTFHSPFEERDNGRRVGGSAETADAAVQTSAALVPWPTDDAFDPAPGADADADAAAAAVVVADDSVEFELARVGQGTGSSG